MFSPPLPANLTLPPREKRDYSAPNNGEQYSADSARHKRLMQVKPQIPLHYFLQDLITFVQLAPLCPILRPVEKENPF